MEKEIKMKTIKTIREDLKEIRYYYSKQKDFDHASKMGIPSLVIEKVDRYNQAMKNAPIRLYDLYVTAYVNNNSLVTIADDWGLSDDYVKQLNRKLYDFLLSSTL